MKVNDIRPNNLQKGLQKAEQKDIEWLAAREGQFVKVVCPACDSESSSLLYKKKAMNRLMCNDCKMEFASPRPNEKLLAEFYEVSKVYSYFAKYIFPASRESRREMLFRPRAELVINYANRFGIKGGTIIEIGSAFGLFCEEIKKLGRFDRVIGVEPTPDLAEICRLQGIETIELPYEKIVLDESVDFIVHFEVIEHLFNPTDFIQWCEKSLKPGGIMIATCPNIYGFESRILGKESTAIDHEHINLFSPNSLSILLKKCHFEIIEITTPGKLDLDLIHRAVSENRFNKKEMDPLLAQLVFHPDQSVQDDFLKLLQKANLTGNMLVVAKKPKTIPV